MKPLANYHTHTYLCGHAKGTPLDYVNQAIKDGCTEIGFTDHVPYPENFVDPWPGIRMPMSDIPTYRDLVQEAKDNSPVPVYFGFECEWDSRNESFLRDEILGKQKAEYLILGSHWVSYSDHHDFIGDKKITPKDINLYIDQTIKGMSSGLFKFLAHPEIFMSSHIEWDDDAISWSKALIDAAKDLNLPLEVNGGKMTSFLLKTNNGIRFRYPYDEFWQLASESGCKILCNSDAHDPENVIFFNRCARDFGTRYNLNIMDKLEF